MKCNVCGKELDKLIVDVYEYIIPIDIWRNRRIDGILNG